ncbi:MAG TPA: hypothetical protein VMH36_03005 [Alphaproteobacteria bacterium]|nr:hypothetical protein [Alphaproteobacteria bacterium]
MRYDHGGGASHDTGVSHADAGAPARHERAAALIEGARRELSNRNIATAEALCRQVLDDGEESPGCWNMIGVIAAEIGLFDHAARAFRRALEIDPAFDKARGNLKQIEAATPPPRRPAGQPGFLVIKAWGQGFWSDVDHVLGQLLVAEVTGRTPIVHWGNNSRFRGVDTEEAFRLYFEPVSPCQLTDLHDRPDEAFWPPKWSARNLDAGAHQQTDGPWSRLSALRSLARPEEIVVSDFYTGISTLAAWMPSDHPLSKMTLPALYRYLCSKYLHPVRDIQARVDDLFAAMFKGERVLAVHARGTDKIDENPDLGALNRQLLHEAQTWADKAAASRVFLLSDSSALVTAFRNVFGRHLITLDVQRSDSGQSLHFQARNGHALGLEVMTDTYLAARADWFLGNGDSNVSAMVEHFRDWPEGRFRLLRPSVHYRRQLV